jgi:6-pyruvoyl-tetrahydropterin synthase
MNDVKKIHREAISLLDDALLLKRNGDYEGYRTKIFTAFEKEREAAKLLEDKFDIEPTRSVLFRSAASLAFYYCDMSHEALKLLFLGFSGNPPSFVKCEMLEIIEDIVEQKNEEILNLQNKLKEKERQLLRQKILDEVSNSTPSSNNELLSIGLVGRFMEKSKEIHKCV